ncbi:MAG: MalY/PatB family protein [Proteocatella sp.]
MSSLEVFESRCSESKVKWSQCGKNRIPMGVADMDFKMDERISSHLKEFAEKGDFGYATYDVYEESVLRWMKQRYDWDVPEKWLVFCPGTLSGLSVLIGILTERNDAVMIFSPVYNRFFDIIRANERKIVESELINVSSHYEINFEDMEKKIASENVKVLLLSSPHNPVCRVWTVEEQSKIVDICKKYGVVIISDEIHADLTLSGYCHYPFLKNNMDYAENIIVTTSPSKAFNMPGLYIANFMIPNDSIRKAYLANFWAHPNIFGAEALKIAYSQCEDWLHESISYIEENYNYLKVFMGREMPKINIIKPEATYLAWLDCRKMGLSQEELMDFFLNKAQVYVGNGADYGDCGQGYVRMNIACSIGNLKEAMERLKSAY